MTDQNSSSLCIWLLIQVVAEDFYNVDRNSIVSSDIHFKQAGLKAMW